MSDAQHRAAARREEAAAVHAERLAHPMSTPASASDDTGWYDPGDDHRREASKRREQARQHTSAAVFLEQLEDGACVPVPREHRAACPLLGPLVRLDDIPGGVRATFADPSRARRAIAEMRCQNAYARTRHFEPPDACPLSVQGIEIRPGLDPRWVEIVSRDEEAVRLVRARAREQAVYARSTR
jgi:hypothetical protein